MSRTSAATRCRKNGADSSRLAPDCQSRRRFTNTVNPDQISFAAGRNGPSGFCQSATATVRMPWWTSPRYTAHGVTHVVVLRPHPV